MALNKVKLDPYYLARLYRQPLIPYFDRNKLKPEKQEPDQVFLGNNRQNILFLIFNKKEIFLSEPLFTFLTQILKACKLSMNDIALVNWANVQENELKELTQQLAPHKMILFGPVIPEIFPENHPKNEVWTTTGIHHLYTDPLEDLYDNKHLKTDFWKGLQQLFELKK
jgi:hypothetical protein